MTEGAGWDDAYYAVDRTEFLDWIGGRHERVLEIGCGSGRSAAWYRSHGASTVVGVELDPTSAAKALQAGFDEVLAMPIEQALDRLSGKYDLIVCADVLEHLIDPWTVVSRLKLLALSRGTLAVSIPNVRFLGTLIPIAFGSGFEYPPINRYDAHTTFDVTHLRFFTRVNVRSMLTRGGWHPERWGVPRGRRLPRLRAILARLSRGRSNDYLAAQWYVVSRPE